MKVEFRDAMAGRTAAVSAAAHPPIQWPLVAPGSVAIRAAAAETAAPRPRACGFTMLDLLAMVAMLACMASLLAPALARTRPNSHTVQCLTNTRRLVVAWEMYAADNNGRLPANLTPNMGGVGSSGYGPGWAAGWLDWTTATDNTNLQLLLNIRYATMAPYLSPAGTNVFKCPADTYLSDIQRVVNWTRRVRSYSMSFSIGPGNAPAIGVFDSMYRQIIKDSDFLYPSPGDTFVFVDEHADSINDPGIFSPTRTAWVDLPAIYHNGGAAFAFADGHTELHRWTASLSHIPTIQYTWNPPPPIPAGDRDLHWVSYHSGRISTNSY